MYIFTGFFVSASSCILYEQQKKLQYLSQNLKKKRTASTMWIPPATFMNSLRQELL